jgi:xanthine dehydrogenase accessory factor
MREIFPQLDQWTEQGEEIALATLVDTHGPAPRPAGARLGLTRGGGMSGSVSGGCVETDVYQRALEVLDSGKPVVQDYGIDDGTSVAVGLSCGGRIDVLIEPFRPDDAWSAVREAVESQEPTALCIAIAPDGIVGRRLAVLAGGRSVGGIAPELDPAAIEAASSLLLDGGRRVLTLPFEGGEARVFVESLPPQPRLFVAGATHTAIPLCRMAKELGFRVSVLDPRTPFASEERFPMVDELLLEWPHEVLERSSLDAWSFVLTLTHDLKFDIPTLACALRSDARYIGALGSRRTHERRKQRLIEEGFDEAAIARIHTPIGLDIGARSPEEIALAILAEMVAVRHGRDGRPLVKRAGPIHSDG